MKYLYEYLFNFSNPTSLSIITDTQYWFIPLDIFRIICLVFTILLGIGFLILVIVDKTCHIISIMLISNTCLAQLCSAINTLLMVIFTLRNDLQQIQYQDTFCMLRGYFTNVFFAVTYYSLLVQAVYHYTIVVYPTRYYCQRRSMQLFFIIFSWLLSLSYYLILIFKKEMVYNTESHICQAIVQLSLMALYIVSSIYVIPVSIIMLIYLKLIRFVKQMSKRIAHKNTLYRAKQELKLIQRIVILIAILLTGGLPYTYIVFKSFINYPPKYHFRIAYIFLDATLPFVMIVMFIFTKPLKDSAKKLINRRYNTTRTSMS